ncbi:nitroreductase [Streptomyces sp. SAI-135]|uniref:nitroreductase family protein n=1 Tax=unclassified Streptomyces TaxID=2593676 RepID=UPI002476536C|nr:MULTISPECIES: nitroreductase family protein [unclassified Streptomyces]MDH6522836.1 nitroreductase [Streptomyces sp. SAI-090]MDH6613549.1 nitroreductase [Streptomyces sp. SAI-135]
MTDRIDLFEALESCRSIRRLRPDPLPDELLEKLVHYATRAPSAGNSQLWKFLVVTAPQDRRWFRDMLVEAVGHRFPEPAPADTSAAARGQRRYRQFIFDFDQIPVLVLPLIENAFPNRDNPDVRFAWSSIYAATQNLLLAARGLGIGAAMTTNHLENEPAVRERFAIPATFHIGATIPLGYPVGRYGPVTRKPVIPTMYRGRFGAPWTTGPTDASQNEPT